MVSLWPCTCSKWGSECIEFRHLERKKILFSLQALVPSQWLHLRSGQDRLWICPGSVTILWINNRTPQPTKSVWYPILVNQPRTENLAAPLPASQWQRLLSFPLSSFLGPLVDKFFKVVWTWQWEETADTGGLSWTTDRYDIKHN